VNDSDDSGNGEPKFVAEGDVDKDAEKGQE
jgi:hypothetical protein